VTYTDIAKLKGTPNYDNALQVMIRGAVHDLVNLSNTLSNFIIEKMNSPEYAELIAQKFENFLKTLTNERIEVFYHRYGFGTGEPMGYTETSRNLSYELSADRVKAHSRTFNRTLKDIAAKARTEVLQEKYDFILKETEGLPDDTVICKHISSDITVRQIRFWEDTKNISSLGFFYHDIMDSLSKLNRPSSREALKAEKDEAPSAQPPSYKQQALNLINSLTEEEAAIAFPAINNHHRYNPKT
jgi:hypothetical protein